LTTPAFLVLYRSFFSVFRRFLIISPISSSGIPHAPTPIRTDRKFIRRIWDDKTRYRVTSKVARGGSLLLLHWTYFSSSVSKFPAPDQPFVPKIWGRIVLSTGRFSSFPLPPSYTASSPHRLIPCLRFLARVNLAGLRLIDNQTARPSLCWGTGLSLHPEGWNWIS